MGYDQSRLNSTPDRQAAGRVNNARRGMALADISRVSAKPIRMKREPRFSMRLQPVPKAPEKGGESDRKAAARHALGWSARNT